MTISRNKMYFVALLVSSLATFTTAFAPPTKQRHVTNSMIRPSSQSSVTTLPSTTTLNLFGFKEKNKVDVEKEEEEVPTPTAETSVEPVVAVEEKTKVDAKEQMANMMKPIKEAGPAGALSLFLWEGAFWLFSIPICSILYYQATGSWPDWTQKEDVAKVTAEAFAFANIARFALPLRVGLAVATTPWVKDNIVDRFGLFQGKADNEEEEKTNGVE
ncbi:hypothetical protein IV203_023940 [Nitzschia inconspicua]|uniref:DUF1279 domain-containing protein n=1 Tax=Nitzschia inconspicua TaxID=303405 RepID=A0A9K3KAY7_9STRA|nr:hypothetical protein IV203_023940 [Nitzschia inconspicua]